MSGADWKTVTRLEGISPDFLPRSIGPFPVVPEMKLIPGALEPRAPRAPKAPPHHQCHFYHFTCVGLQLALKDVHVEVNHLGT